ncbi:hypothetical protein Phum_PHUM321900 [Pediculus humanus corporis]|uniref:Uncharacterized protein n=1 Tax=Pediculus humanus subsp. corporis TaxID=121224 RepID=E0VMY5_PEDHC|nr:uncharacterized protein Phum_PHUM321900 [Pediculus humanus corporis]EEB14741.1 hypothetical protein Phum_PHUM321900 [Pediculus humanus corporis]
MPTKPFPSSLRSHYATRIYPQIYPPPSPPLRATLAEKEVNALKEQLTTAKNQTKLDSGEQQLLSNKMADCEQQTLELISRNNFEGELASKDKEVIKKSSLLL